MLISENERFRQEIHADQRHCSFSAQFQLVLDRTKPIRSFGGENENYPARVFSLKTSYTPNTIRLNKTDKTGF
jgi:hypothetical protein